MSNSFALFNRNYAVYIGPQGQTGKKFDKLRVQFEIEKTSDSNPNKSKIEIYNLSASTRALFKKGDAIRVDAGYQGLTETLYLGDIARIVHKRNQSDIVSTFEAGDSERLLIQSHFNKSYGAGTTVLQIVQDLANALSISIGPILGLQNQVYNKGITMSGAINHLLKKICDKQGLEFSVQNSTLQIIPKTAHTGEEAIVLTPQTGLIGIPSPKDDGLEFNALLNPKIQPGRICQIKSENVNGFFKVRKAKFEGDSHGDKWGVLCEGVEINAQQVIATSIGGKFVAGNTVVA